MQGCRLKRWWLWLESWRCEGRQWRVSSHKLDDCARERTVWATAAVCGPRNWLHLGSHDRELRADLPPHSPSDPFPAPSLSRLPLLYFSLHRSLTHWQPSLIPIPHLLPSRLSPLARRPTTLAYQSVHPLSSHSLANGGLLQHSSSGVLLEARTLLSLLFNKPTTGPSTPTASALTTFTAAPMSGVH